MVSMHILQAFLVLSVITVSAWAFAMVKIQVLLILLKSYPTYYIKKMIRKLGFSHSCRLNWALVSHIAHSQKFPYEITVIRYDTIRLDWWHMTVSFRWQSSKFMQQIYISWDIRIIFRQQQHNTTKPHCCTYTANELASDMWDNNMPFTPPPVPPLTCPVSLSLSWGWMGVSTFTACQ